MKTKNFVCFLLVMVIICTSILSGCGTRKVPEATIPSAPSNLIDTEHIRPTDPSDVIDSEKSSPDAPSNLIDTEHIPTAEPSDVINSEENSPNAPSNLIDTEHISPTEPSDVGNTESTNLPALPNTVNLENIEIMEELLVPHGWAIPDRNFIIIEEDGSQDFVFKADLVLDESIITDEGESLAELLNSSDHTDWMKVATCERATSDMLIQCANNCISWFCHETYFEENPFEYVTDLAEKLVQHPNTCDEIIHIFLRCSYLELLEVLSVAKCNTSTTLGKIADNLGNIITSSFQGDANSFLKELNSIAINLLEHPACNSQIVLRLAKSDNINFWPILASASCNDAQSLEILATLFSQLTTSENIDSKTFSALEDLMLTCTNKLLNHPCITTQAVLTLSNSTFAALLPVLASAKCNDAESLEALAKNVVGFLVPEDSKKLDNLYKLQYSIFTELLNHPAATSKVVIALSGTCFLDLLELLSTARCNDSESLLVLANSCRSLDHPSGSIAQIESLARLLYSVSKNLINQQCATPEVIMELAHLQLVDIWEVLATAECNNSASLLLLAEMCASIRPYYLNTKLEASAYSIAQNLIAHPKCSLAVLEQLRKSPFPQVQVLVTQALNS